MDDSDQKPILDYQIDARLTPAYLERPPKTVWVASLAVLGALLTTLLGIFVLALDVESDSLVIGLVAITGICLATAFSLGLVELVRYYRWR